MIRCIGTELSSRKDELKHGVESVYFGGGTPSLLTLKELSFLMDNIYSSYRVLSNAEITIEANPENITDSSVAKWKKAGFNRLSIGLQSFKESDLKWMNRGHTAQDNLSAISRAKKAGITNISVDLIYGLPGLTLKEWEMSLKKVVQLGVAHISAYCLTVEDKTKLKHDIKKGDIVPLPEKKQVEHYTFLVSYLKKNGYEQYEVSNFAKDKAYSRHNSAYWKRKRFIGVGPSAHSFDGATRRWNISNNPLYLKHINNKSSYYSVERLDKNAVWNELFLTGLRTMWGVDKKQINALGGFIIKEEKEMLKLKQQGLIVESKDKFTLSKKGFLFADAISASFFRVSG
jgi:oxygen-independent coproporphyrinogen-3 oxidase